jgi:hypothetical protein
MKPTGRLTIAPVDTSTCIKSTAAINTSALNARMKSNGLFRPNDQLSSAPTAKHVIEEYCRNPLNSDPERKRATMKPLSATKKPYVR